MSASNTDKITDVRNAARPNSARVSSGRSAGGATLACDNLVGWPTASKVHFVTYQIDSNSNPVAGTQLDCYGIRSGNNITSLVVVDGTDAGNAVNDVVEMLPTAAWGQDLADALTTAHDRLGVHKAGAVYATPTITDFTNADHTHASTAQGGQLTGAAIATGSQLADRLLNPYKFYVYRNAAWTDGNSTNVIVGFDTKVFDTGSNVDVVTNKGRFTAPIAGFYFFVGSTASTINAGQIGAVNLFKNGSLVLAGTGVDVGAASVGMNRTVSGLLQLSANDYIEVGSYGTNNAGTTGVTNTYFQGFLVSAS